MLGSLLDHDLKVENFLSAADPISTMSALERVGFKYQYLHDLNAVNILNSKKRVSDPDSTLNLGNSGTGLRLMLGFLGGLNIKADYIGDNSLSARPMARVLDPLSQMGIKYNSNAGRLPINYTEKGALAGPSVTVRNEAQTLAVVRRRNSGKFTSNQRLASYRL